MKKTLNEKLTNVEIKVPEIEIPQSNIIVQVQKKCDSDNYDVHVHKNNNITNPSQKIGLSPSKQFIKNVKVIEEFDSINNDKSKLFEYDANKDIFDQKELTEDEKKHLKYKSDLQRIQKDTILFDGRTLPKIVNQEDESIEIIQHKSLFPTNDKYITYPDYDQIIDYNSNCPNNKDKIIDHGNYVCIEKSYFNKEYNPNKIKKYNTEVVQNILKNDEKYNNNNDLDNINAYDKWNGEDEINYMEYFIKNRQFVTSSFEDGVTKGGNIADFNEFGGLEDIGKIKLGKNKYNFPRPNNYIFKN